MPVVFGKRFEFSEGWAAGVIDEDIEAAELLDGGVDDLAGVFGFQDVDGDGEDLAFAECGDLFGSGVEGGGVAGADDDVGAFGGECEGAGFSEAFAGGEYEGCLVCELEVDG